ncbi:hydrogenase small subunit [Geoalkalibacter halelectricus]|uniref:hydrogenase small subunit n=1 Tax=Geoalkalibacter halelectricus TaxID=2847045 RepID=UPI003D23882F
MKMTRRTFLKDAGIFVAALGLEPVWLPKMADALEEMAYGRAPILWLQGLSCSGCSVSLLNSESPGPADLITRYLSLYFHQTLSAATGPTAKDAVERAIAKGGYILVVEGAVPLTLREACKFADENFADQLLRAARSAQAVVSTGTCAAFGGIPAAPPNLTGAAGVDAALKQAGLRRPLINLPGCPAHPAWIVGTLMQVLKVGMPDLDAHLRPKIFYDHLLHEQCPLFALYQKKHFAENLGEEGCLFKMGCQGVITQADCSLRGWNGGVSWCIRGRSNCIGCARPEFALDPRFAFFRLNEENLF